MTPDPLTPSTPPSLNIFEAVDRLFTLAGISQEPGWDLYDSNIYRKLDEVRERMQELYSGIASTGADGNSPTPADYDPETFIRELADRWAKIEIPSGKPYVPFMRDRYAACMREYREVVLRECDGDGRIEEIVVQANKIKELERENAALVKEREELARDKETFQRRLQRALQTIDELNELFIEDNI